LTYTKRTTSDEVCETVVLPSVFNSLDLSVISRVLCQRSAIIPLYHKVSTGTNFQSTVNYRKEVTIPVAVMMKRIVTSHRYHSTPSQVSRIEELGGSLKPNLSRNITQILLSAQFYIIAYNGTPLAPCLGPSAWKSLPSELCSLPQDLSSSFYKLLKTFIFARAWEHL